MGSARRPDDIPRLTVAEIRLYERDVTMRLPFRFGVVTLTEAPQAFARVRIRTAAGQEAWGKSAELLAPKWFDKSPALSNTDNFEQLRIATRLAARRYLDAGGPHTGFGLFAACYDDLVAACAKQDLNGLVAGFGPALLDRAILDALCRAADLTVFDAVRANLPGLETSRIAPDLTDFDVSQFLTRLGAPERIAVRHTIGMADPITDADVTPDTDPNDGLPVTLEQAIATYGHRHFKVTVANDVSAAMDRLRRIAAVLDRSADPYLVSIDGGEQFAGRDGIAELWQEIGAAPDLARFQQSVAFIEQPIDRATTFKTDVGDIPASFIIDEADGDFGAFPRARALGYRGASYKGCKGIYKGLINAARCHAWNAEAGGAQYFLTAEDLSTQAGVCLQQDTAFAALLGVGHVQRNGHHYVNGFSGVSPTEAEAFLRAHPDLYHRADGMVRVSPHDGHLALGSLHCSGFAVAAEPDWQAMREISLK